jgi:SPP1 gp7 family putative phage head morphogenesis protein
MNQQDIDKLLDKMIEQAEKDIDVVFAKRLKAVHDHIAKLYRKYSDGEGISRTDIYKYNRFESEMEFLKQNIHGDYKDLYSRINNLMKSSYVENYLRSGFLYEFEAQTPMQYTIPSAATVNQAILNPIKELTLSSLMNQHRNEIIRNIRLEIAQGIQAGEDYASMARRIEDRVGFSQVKAKRVARTEAHRVQSEARLNSGEQASKYADLTKTWNATLDTRVRPAHRRLDDNEADENGNFTYRGNKAKAPGLFLGPNSASLNINCRCSLLFLVNGKRPELRRARNDDGSTSVIPYQSFDNWRKGLKKAG